MQLTGEPTTGTVKFRFTWIGRNDLPTQDLPKPQLMCAQCDNTVGDRIEGPTAKILIPKNHKKSPEAWNRLDLDYFDLKESLGKRFVVGVYKCGPDSLQHLHLFSLLTAWRAYHAMRTDGNPNVLKCAGTSSASDFDDYVRCIVNIAIGREAQTRGFGYQSNIYFLGPNYAAMLTGRDDEVPFAWAFLGSQSATQTPGVAILLGYWVVLVPLVPEDAKYLNIKTLEKTCFDDWHFQLFQQFRGRLGAAPLQR